MTGINSDAFFWPSLSRDGLAFQAENAVAFGLPGHLRGAKPRIALVPVDAVDLLQALPHRLFQVIAGLAELRVAAGDELVLLLLQLANIRRLLRFADRPDVGAVN